VSGVLVESEEGTFLYKEGVDRQGGGWKKKFGDGVIGSLMVLLTGCGIIEGSRRRARARRSGGGGGLRHLMKGLRK